MESYSLNVKYSLENYELIKSAFFEDLENYLLKTLDKNLKTKIKQVEMDI